MAVAGVGPGPQELVSPVAATQQPDAQNPRAARRELIPDGIANDIALARRNPESLPAGDEQVRLRFGARDVATFDDHDVVADAEYLERAIDLGAPAGGGDAVRDLPPAQISQQLHGARKRPPLREKFAE